MFNSKEYHKEYSHNYYLRKRKQIPKINIRECKRCGKRFNSGEYDNKFYCSHLCQKRDKNRRYYKKYHKIHSEIIKKNHDNWKEKNREKIRKNGLEYYYNHIAECSLRNRLWRIKNKDNIKIKEKLFRAKNKDKAKEYHKKYFIKNKAKIRERGRLGLVFGTCKQIDEKSKKIEAIRRAYRKKIMTTDLLNKINKGETYEAYN